MELPKEKKVAQVEELVKHQIYRVEKILESSLTRTAALIEQQKKRAKEDEVKRQNIEKNRVILNTIDTSRENKLIKTKRDGDQNVQENKLNDALISKVSQDYQGKVSSNSVHTQMSSKTFKSVGTNTDAKFKLQSKVSEDKPAQLTLDQQLVIYHSTADRKRKQFAGRKVNKHTVRKVTGPICTISISIDQPLERNSSNTEESPECKRIVVETHNCGSIGRDVFSFSDAVQKNHLQFCNRGNKLLDIAQTVTSNEQRVDNKGKLTLDLDVSEIHKNCQIKEYVPKTVPSLKGSSINNKSAKSRIKGVGVESDFSEISNTTPELTTSEPVEIRLPHHISVSSDSSSGKLLIKNVKAKRHKRKAKITKHNESSESETYVSSRQNEELSRKVTKDTPERNDMKSFRITKIHTWKKTFDLDKRAKSDGDNFQSSRHSEPELRNIRKAECERHNAMKCVSEGNRRSYPSTTGRSPSGQNIDQSKRRINPSHYLFTVSCDQTGMKSFSNHQPNSPHETASISSDNTSCGLSRNVSKASVEYNQLDNEHCVSSKTLNNDKVEPNDIACYRLVGHEKAIKYSLFDSVDCIPADPDWTNSNQNTQHHDASEYVTLLKEVEDAVETETNLKLKADQTDTCQFEKIKSYTGSREPDTKSIQNDMTINNREQSPSATDIGGDNVLDLVTSLDNTATMVQAVLKSESTPDTQNPCDKNFPSAQTLFDDSSSTARSFEDKYHLVMDTLEKHLIVSQTSEDSNDTPADDIRLHKKGGRSRSKSVSLENSVSSGKSLKRGPLSDQVISNPKQLVQLSSEFHSQVNTSEDAVQERLFGDINYTIQLRDKENSKFDDVISYSMSKSSVKVDEVTATSGFLDSLIHNHSIQDERESTLNDTDLSLNLTSKLENNQTQADPIDITIDESSASVPTSDFYNDVLTSGTSFRFKIEESSASVPCPKQNQVVDERCISIDNKVGESCSPNELDSTDNEGLDSSFYERSASRRNNIKTAYESSSSDVSFVAESSVSSLKVFVPAYDKERSQHDNASDSSVSVPLSLAYYSDLVTPVTSLRYVIDEWSEPLGKQFKIKHKPKRINRKKIITDVHVKISGDNRRQLQSLRRISTPCHVSKSVSATSSIHESDLVKGESELSTSGNQYSSIHALANTDDNELNKPESNLDRTTVSHFKDDHDDSILSSNSSVAAYERRPHVTRVTNYPVFRSTNSRIHVCGGLEDGATTTDDVESSILPEDVDDTTDIDEQLQMEENDFSEVTDVLGTSTETFTKIENPKFKPM